MSTMKNKVPLLLLTNLFLSGCGSHVANSQNDNTGSANKIIAEKVSEAVRAQQDYVAIVNNDKAVLGRKQSSFNTDLIDLDFFGQPQEALQYFSYRYGYRYSEVGKWRKLKPVNIKVHNMSPEEALRNIGYQIDKGADVTLDQKNKIIRLSYK